MNSSRFFRRGLCGGVAFGIVCLAPRVFAADAAFSADGHRVYFIDSEATKPALREIDLSYQTSRVIPLPQLSEKDGLRGVVRGDEGKILCLSAKALWSLDPTSRRLTKVKDAPKNASFWRLAFNQETHAVLLTTDQSSDPLLLLLPNERELKSVYVRRHPRIGSLVFSALGELFYAESGDLWKGNIEEDEGRYSLNGYRYAPLGSLETANSTPSETGVSEIGIARDAIYVQLYRMGGSGWGSLVKLPRPPQKTDASADEPGDQLALYRDVLEKLQPLGEANRPISLCTSPDEARVFYINDGKFYLIADGQTEELHLQPSEH